MVAKRRLDFSKVTDLPLTKRVRKVERIVRLNRPELKTFSTGLTTLQAINSISVVKPCNIQQGSDVNERIGNKIRVWRIEVRGNSDNRLDNLIIRKTTSTDPVIGDFRTPAGSYVLDEKRTQFVELVHKQSNDTNSNATFKMSYKFRGGLLVSYNGPNGTDGIDNEVIWVVVNRSSVACVSTCSVRIWYTDA